MLAIFNFCGKSTVSPKCFRGFWIRSSDGLCPTCIWRLPLNLLQFHPLCSSQLDSDWGTSQCVRYSVEVVLSFHIQGTASSHIVWQHKLKKPTPALVQPPGRCNSNVARQQGDAISKTNAESTSEIGQPLWQEEQTILCVHAKVVVVEKETFNKNYLFWHSIGLTANHPQLQAF